MGVAGLWPLVPPARPPHPNLFFPLSKEESFYKIPVADVLPSVATHPCLPRTLKLEFKLLCYQSLHDLVPFTCRAPSSATHSSFVLESKTRLSVVAEALSASSFHAQSASLSALPQLVRIADFQASSSKLLTSCPWGNLPELLMKPFPMLFSATGTHICCFYMYPMASWLTVYMFIHLSCGLSS